MQVNHLRIEEWALHFSSSCVKVLQDCRLIFYTVCESIDGSIMKELPHFRQQRKDEASIFRIFLFLLSATAAACEYDNTREKQRELIPR